MQSPDSALQALEAAGCFAVLIECVPPAVAAAVTREVGVPTIGIGAGPHTSGQARLLLAIAAAHLQMCCAKGVQCMLKSLHSDMPATHMQDCSISEVVTVETSTVLSNLALLMRACFLLVRCWCTTTCWA